MAHRPTTFPADPDPQFPGGPADGAEPDLAPVSSATQSTAALMEVPEDVGGREADTAVYGEKQQPQTAADTQARPVDTQSQRLSLGAPADGRTFMPALESDENRQPTQLAVTAGGAEIEHQGFVG